MSRGLRIAILTSNGETWGGSEELWFETARALADAGHDVVIFKPNVVGEHPRIRALRECGCAVHDLNRGGPALLWQAAGSPLLAPAAARLQMLNAGPRLCLPRRPDVTIVSQGGNYDGAGLARMCQQLRLPYLLVSQKASPLYWPPDGSRAFIRRVHEGARRTVFVSEHNLALTRLQLDADLPHAVVVDNPVLAGREGPLPWPAAPGPIRLACVGRLYVKEKGQDMLLEVLARPRWRDREIVVDVYGDGLNGESITAMARRLDLPRVTVRGFVRDLEAIWRDHHALVLCSRTEGLPLVVHEAMACGRVPIVTAAGGTAELVEDGTTGFVATDPGVEAIDTALERAWTRREEWPTIGRRAAERMQGLLAARPAAPLAELALAEVRRA